MNNCPLFTAIGCPSIAETASRLCIKYAQLGKFTLCMADILLIYAENLHKCRYNDWWRC